jgi:hypothetical protein
MMYVHHMQPTVTVLPHVMQDRVNVLDEGQKLMMHLCSADYSQVCLVLEQLS